MRFNANMDVRATVDVWRSASTFTLVYFTRFMNVTHTKLCLLHFVRTVSTLEAFSGIFHRVQALRSRGLAFAVGPFSHVPVHGGLGPVHGVVRNVPPSPLSQIGTPSCGPLGTCLVGLSGVPWSIRHVPVPLLAVPLLRVPLEAVAAVLGVGLTAAGFGQGVVQTSSCSP